MRATWKRWKTVQGYVGCVRGLKGANHENGLLSSWATWRELCLRACVCGHAIQSQPTDAPCRAGTRGSGTGPGPCPCWCRCGGPRCAAHVWAGTCAWGRGLGVETRIVCVCGGSAQERMCGPSIDHQPTITMTTACWEAEQGKQPCYAPGSPSRRCWRGQARPSCPQSG